MPDKNSKSQIGMVGLGLMGRNFVINIAEHGFSAAGYDKDPAQAALLRTEASGLPVQCAEDVATFIAMLETPHSVMLLVPAGPVVDNVIRGILPHLQKGDLVIDAGNSHFTDTDLREQTLESLGLYFMGMGISGGEEGARHGPSLMPGGQEAAYHRIQGIMEATAAQVDGEPCVTYLGPHSAGHYVKMVHNGIEYGMMQLIAEAYDLLNRGLDLPDPVLAELFDEWNQSELGGYLVEITADIIRTRDEITGMPLVDIVRDSAKQLGTGMWASQDAMSLHIPTPTIDTAVAMRNLSAQQAVRTAIGSRVGAQRQHSPGQARETIKLARQALYAGLVLTYAQGFAQMATASTAYGYQLDLASVARIWRGGCIIRSNMLEPISTAFKRKPDLPHLLMDDELGQLVFERLPHLRKLVKVFAETGIPAPAFMASLGYLDSLRATHLPANLIQAQRDYFGSHTYERVDRRGVFHTEWTKDFQDDDDSS